MGENMKVNYAIYPTLLDSFYWYKRKGDLDEILNKINRVKKSDGEKAEKGVSFESVINEVLKTGEVIENSFNSVLITRVAAKLQNATKQREYIQANVATAAGLIKVYGFVDYVYPDMYVDLKTATSYKPGKYSNGNQHKCYPLLSQLNGGKVDRFNYLVTDFKDMYIEPYRHTSEMKDEFIFNLVEFTEFLETHRGKITDKKIFGLK